MDTTCEIFYHKKSTVTEAKNEYDANLKVMMCHSTGLPVKEDVIENHRAIMKFMETHPTRGIIYNLLNIKGTFTQTNKFMSEEFIPFLNKHKIECVAIAFTADIFSRFAINTVLKLSEVKFDMKIFGTWAEAKRTMEQKLNVTLPWNF